MELIKNYGGYILTIVSIIVTIISFILKNKSNKNYKKVFSVLSFLPQFIDEAEKTFLLVNKSGENKLDYVLNKLQALCCDMSLQFDGDFWIKKIEEYLSTPQKK